MLFEAVGNLENIDTRCQRELDELENQLCGNIQNAAPLMSLCNRLRNAKVKLAFLKNKIDEYNNAEENLRVCVSKCLDPASNILHNAGRYQEPQSNYNYNGNYNYNYNPQSITPKRQNQAFGSSINNRDDSFHNEIPLPEKKNRQSTPKNTGTSKIQMKSPVQQIQYQEVDEAELATLDTRSYGHISLNDIRELHQYIWDFFQNSANKNKVLTQKQLQDDFPKIRTLRSTLRFLKSLKRIDLTKDGNVKCALS
ncbi:hypothetical protein M9Y10_021661 [Tritrichomonas musculus]|uniref:Spindle and kinetochore-associated protein 2 n=1 Tax=Tritrichomonas musculus TaxID=1915356 RepID=A0ABR2KQ00_9EUKA